MSRIPTLSAEQYERVANGFSRILDEGLTPETANERIIEESAGDLVIAAALREMLEAHVSESDDSGFHESAMDVVLDETRRAGEVLERHTPERIGPYRVLRFVASGGMGTVYEAEQDEPRRRVAIKVIRLELLTDVSVQRFEDEGHLLARLRHPGIARVYSMGRTETAAGTVPYLVLEFIDGLPIAEYAREHDLSVADRVALLRKVADAVQYAHDNGVLHRDLKPGNVLVDKTGQPHVLDFGIGRTFDDEHDHASLTASGLFLGTLAYMSPEQAVRSKRPLDVRVDVHGVGAIGYELLAGQPPQAVKGMPLHEAVQRVAHKEPTPLDQLDSSVGADLSAIFGKALARDPDRRYRSVRELDNDLQRYLDHEPVEARPPSRFYQVSKLVRRHRTTFGLLTLLIVTLVAGLAISLQQRRNALDAKAAATKEALEATRDRRAATLSATWRAIEEGRVLEVVEAVTPFAAEDENFVEHQLLRAHTQNAIRIATIEELPERVEISVSRLGDRGIATDAEGRILYVDLQTTTTRPLFPDGPPHADIGRHNAWSSSEPAHAIFESSTRFSVVDTRNGGLVQSVTLDAPTTPLDAANQSLFLWHTCEGGRRVVDVVSGRVVEDERLLDLHRASAVLQGRYLVRGTETLDLITGEREVVQSHTHARERSADGRFTLFGAYRPIVRDHVRKDEWALEVHQGLASYAITFSADSRHLGVHYLDGSVQLWDLHERVLLTTCWDTRVAAWVGTDNSRARPGTYSLCFLPGGRLRTVLGNRVIDWTTAPPSLELDHSSSYAKSRYVYRVAWHPKGRWLASAAWDGTIGIWDAWTGELVRRMDVAAALGPKRLAESKGIVVPAALLWGRDGDQVLIRMPTTNFQVIFDAWSGEVRQVGRCAAIVLALDGETAWVPDPETEEPVSIPVRQLADARAVPAAAKTPPAWAWQPGPWCEVLNDFVCSERYVARIVGHGSKRAWTGYDVWDRDGNTYRQRVSGMALSVRLTDGGRRILAGTRSGTLQIYDAETRRRLMVLHGHEDYVIATATAPDGSAIATGSGDGWVRLWPLQPMRERIARRESARVQAARLAPLVDAAFGAGEDSSGRFEALLGDPRLAEEDRDAALAQLARRSGGAESR